MSDWEKKAAIAATLNAYSGAAGRLDIKAFMSFFLEDAEVRGVAGLFGLPDPIKGHAQIAGLFGPAFERLEWLVQMNTITDIVLGPDGISAHTSAGLYETAKGKDTGMIVLIARYDDDLKLTDKGWRFAKRVLIPHRFSQIP